MTTPLTFPDQGPTTDHNMVQPGMMFFADGRGAGPRAGTQARSTRVWILAVFLGLGLTSGCTSDPFVDGRREAGATRNIGPSTLNRVAICFNGRTTPQQAVLELAESECAKTDRVPQYDGQDRFSCTWGNPTRAFYRCVAPDR